MFDLAETLSGWIYALRITTASQWVVRGVVVVSAAAAAWFSSGWVVAHVWAPWVAVLAVLIAWSAVRPDSSGPLFVVVALAAAWMGGGDGAPWWRLAAVVGCVAVFHLASTYAAAAPSFAHARRS